MFCFQPEDSLTWTSRNMSSVQIRWAKLKYCAVRFMAPLRLYEWEWSRSEVFYELLDCLHRTGSTPRYMHIAIICLILQLNIMALWSSQLTLRWLRFYICIYNGWHSIVRTNRPDYYRIRKRPCQFTHEVWQLQNFQYATLRSFFIAFIFPNT